MNPAEADASIVEGQELFKTIGDARGQGYMSILSAQKHAKSGDADLAQLDV